MTNLGKILVRDLLRQCQDGTDKACNYSRIDVEFDVIWGCTGMQKLRVKYGGIVGREVGQHLFMDLWGDRLSSCWKGLAIP